MSNQNYRQEHARNDARGQQDRDDWGNDRDWQGSRGRDQYRDQEDYRSRGQQGRGGPQDWDQRNYGQGNYRQDDYGRDNFQRGNYGQGGYGRDNYDPYQRGGPDQSGWRDDRDQYDRNYRSERDQYGAGYAQGGQGGYQQGGYQQGGYPRGNYGGGYDRGQGQYGSHQGGHQGGSSWDQGNYGGGMQKNYEGGQSHRGRGPKNYQRSDDRICEDVCDRLSDDDHVDASDIDVSVSNREVTLSGEVDSKQAKRHAEDCADSCSGVEHVQNNLRVKKSQSGRDDDNSSKSKTK